MTRSGEQRAWSKAKPLMMPGAFFMLTAIVAPVASAAERTWTRSEILAIADAEASRSGCDVERMSVSYDVSNSRWHYYLSRHRTFFTDPSINRSAESRASSQCSGDLWVFIDRDTGEAVGTLQGSDANNG